MDSYGNKNNYKYYKITEKSGYVSANYNIKGGYKQKLVAIEIDETSGNSSGMRKYNNYNFKSIL